MRSSQHMVSCGHTWISLSALRGVGGVVLCAISLYLVSCVCVDFSFDCFVCELMYVCLDQCVLICV